MTADKLVKINDREVSETEAFLRREAEWTLSDERDYAACQLTSAADEFAALEQDLRIAIEVARERAEKIAKYETAFAGMWIEPDHNGTPTIWSARLAIWPGRPTALLRSSEVNRTIWTALATILPTEAPE